MEEQAEGPCPWSFWGEPEEATKCKEEVLLNHVGDNIVEAVRVRLAARRPKRPLPTADFDEEYSMYITPDQATPAATGLTQRETNRHAPPEVN